ncbi:uncharacterized protein LOC126559606 [Anopheles maculipalpis]|uniref:uncharacterized protein LOC126559606 n=1 Tax=Anopheles maculipalpis TaxID=1496333 RepID=UPI002158E69D|nr:uncharacterized protein LOC126559606 [Anopheles maculipalpis]
MKSDIKLMFLVLVGATTLLLLLTPVSTVQPPVPYFEQRLGIGPLSWSEMAYLRRLVQEEDDGGTEVTTATAPEQDGSDAWDNSCVSEPVNVGGYSQEEEQEEVNESDEARIPKDV